MILPAVSFFVWQVELFWRRGSGILVWSRMISTGVGEGFLDAWILWSFVLTVEWSDIGAGEMRRRDMMTVAGNLLVARGL
jgi:hypothetical protein